MTVKFTIGRRVPRNFFRRGFQKMSNILTFQEHIWYIINNSLKLAKRKAKKAKSDMVFLIEKYEENEDINYIIQWTKLTIKGKEEEEKGEYEDILKFYDPLDTVFDKNMDFKQSKGKLSSMFKSKLVNMSELEKMYKQGLEESSSNNMFNKLLEVGIMSNVEWIKDFDN
jgi:hypothetical protein